MFPDMDENVDILGIGYCGLDTLCVLPRIPLDDKVRASRTLVQGGGPAATAVVAAARLGLKTAFAGVLGDDARGDAILKEFAREGVDTSAIRRREGAESAAAFCWVEEPTGRRSIAWTHGTAAALDPDEIDPTLIRRARALHCDGHQTAAAIRAAQIAREAGIPVFLDAGTVVPRIDELIALCTVVIASEVFARTFTGLADPEVAARRLAEAGPEWTGVTMGAAGSIGFDGERMHRVAATPAEVEDTTGAGDVYHERVRRAISGAEPSGQRHSRLHALRIGRRRAQVPPFRRPHRHSESRPGRRGLGDGSWRGLVLRQPSIDEQGGAGRLGYRDRIRFAQFGWRGVGVQTSVCRTRRCDKTPGGVGQTEV